MSDYMFENINPNDGFSETLKRDFYCAVCGAKLPTGSIFCLECDPPLPPGKEPEEIGISFKQALFRIIFIVFLFLVVALSRLYFYSDSIFKDNIFDGNLDKNINTQIENKADFKTVHTVIGSSVNIRLKPSINSKVVNTAKQGMNIKVVESTERWTKIRVSGKDGWIFNDYIKSEIVEIK